MNQDEVRRLFDYDSATGELVNRVTRHNNAPAGAKAGSQNGRGYLQVGINKKFYRVHRLIWLWVYGYFPEHQIDHINRDRLDNRLDNLKEVTRSCNMRNASRLSNNKSGVTGVSWHKSRGKWVSRINADNRYKYLGYFTDFTEAVKARHAAEVEHNWPGCNSSTPAYQYLKETQNERTTHEV